MKIPERNLGLRVLLSFEEVMVSVKSITLVNQIIKINYEICKITNNTHEQLMKSNNNPVTS